MNRSDFDCYTYLDSEVMGCKYRLGSVEAGGRTDSHRLRYQSTKNIGARNVYTVSLDCLQYVIMTRKPIDQSQYNSSII